MCFKISDKNEIYDVLNKIIKDIYPNINKKLMHFINQAIGYGMIKLYLDKYHYGYFYTIKIKKIDVDLIIFIKKKKSDPMKFSLNAKYTSHIYDKLMFYINQKEPLMVFLLIIENEFKDQYLL